MRSTSQQSEDEDVQVVVDGHVDHGCAGHVEGERQSEIEIKRFVKLNLIKRN